MSESAGGGVFVFRDGGTYCGEWTAEGAHGYGVCTGAKKTNVFEGRWAEGSQVSGVFSWPSGQRYAGTWANNTRHGLGREARPDGSEYCGDFRHNLRGSYGVLKLSNGALYRGTWDGGLQDGVGVETYADKGVYRGQYKKGRRHGYGTRSSAFYEHTFKLTNTSQDSPAVTRTTKLRSFASADLSTYSPPVTKKLSVAAAPATSTILHGAAQIYEGQWEEDKRHGHGVLKIPGHYTYFGEWLNNARTGHGVLVFDDGRKEEGKWEDGRLAIPLKRKKLSIKQYQMEGRVRQAHTSAIQAANNARTKAILAESRASTSSTKAQAANTVANDAEADAQKALDKKKQYQENALHAETTISPMANIKESPSFNSLGDHSDSPATSLLKVPQSVLSSQPSFEDLSQACSVSAMTTEEEYVEDEVNGVELLDKATDDHILEHQNEEERLDILKRTSSSMSGNMLAETAMPDRNATKQRRRGVTDSRLLGVLHSSSGRLKQRVDKTTGEVLGSADNTDDEGGGDGAWSHSVQHKSLKNRSRNGPVDTDVLLQMANWNKTIAYINFILLFFLLILIVVVVGFLSFTLQTTNRSASTPNFGNPMA